MVKIERLPSGSYRARVHLGGGKYKSITGKDKKEVQLMAAQVEAGVIEAKERKSPYQSMTLGDAMQKYIDLKSAVLSPSTIRSYDSIRRNRVPMLSQMHLDDISQEDIQRAINEDSLTHSPKSVRNLHCFLSAVLDVYKHDMHLDTTLPQKRKTSIAIPTQEELDALMQHFAGSDMELPLALAACCGLRQSEICGLRWRDVDLQTGRIFIRTAKVRNKDGVYVEKAPKSESGERTVRLYPFISDIIRKNPQDGEFVTSLTGSAIYGKFEAALKKLGLPHYRFHDLRHYLVSVMLSLNVPKNYIADYVGHADESMIDRVYGHIMAQKKSEVEDIMDAYFKKSAMKSDTQIYKSLI